MIRDYGIESLPATFLIGPDGKILVSSGRNPTRLWMTQFKDEVRGRREVRTMRAPQSP